LFINMYFYIPCFFIYLVDMLMHSFGGSSKDSFVVLILIILVYLFNNSRRNAKLFYNFVFE
jgi:hypothetical protein